MAFLFRVYSIALIRRPMLASCATAAFLFGAGDVIAQQAIEKRGKNHDYVRTARSCFYRGAMFGPCLIKWYQFLNQIKFSSPTKAVIYRVWLDQAVLAPVAVAFFFGSMCVLEGKANETVDRIKAAYIPTIICSWGVFLPTQIINFAIVPHHLQFVVVSVVSLFWNTYLSAINNAKAAQIQVTETHEHEHEHLPGTPDKVD